ncbi:MAG: M15 family metallopeptidase [Lachnospiraceae bacterium]|nr:M15 family metallopeptidase [Lachnospiraceae bacterium]
MERAKEILIYLKDKIVQFFKFLWKHIKRGFKKLRRWFRRYIRKLIRHTKEKDYSLLIYTIIAIVLFILLIVLLGKLFSHKDKKKEKTTTEITTEMTTEDPAVAARNQLISQANTIYQNNSSFMVLVNATHPLQDGYAFEQYTLNCGEIIDSRIHTDLVNMLEACNEAGHEYTIVSGYRDKAKQQTDYDDTVASYVSQGFSQEEAESEASKYVQKPGYSEHETGLALDIAGLGYTSLDESLATDETVTWLMSNCYNYGFILRYPSDKSAVTGISYEPWHFRYVGIEAAKFIHDNNLTLEEFYQLIGM